MSPGTWVCTVEDQKTYRAAEGPSDGSCRASESCRCPPVWRHPEHGSVQHTVADPNFAQLTLSNIMIACVRSEELVSMARTRDRVNCEPR